MYLVTGGAGFIGSNIVAALSERNDEVVVCDWLCNDERWRNLAKHEISEIIEPETVLAWLRRKGERLRAVVHMGAISATTETNVDLIAARNIRATLELMEWCTDAQVPVIFASSAATYGDGTQGFDDSFTRDSLAKLRPLNAYGWSKHVVDRRLARLVEADAKLPPQWVGLEVLQCLRTERVPQGLDAKRSRQELQPYPRRQALVLVPQLSRAICRRRSVARFRLCARLRRCGAVAAWITRRCPACSIWERGRRAAGWTSPRPYSPRPGGRRRSNSSRCHQRSSRSTSISRKRAWSACARPATNAHLRPWKRALRTTCIIIWLRTIPIVSATLSTRI